MDAKTARITTTELSRNLSDVLNRVRYLRERFIVERNGEVIATVAPPATERVTFREVVARIGDLRMPDPEYADELERVQAEQPPAEMPEWPS